ncbi:MAG TPA: hypothetical protein VFI84_00180 [Candidatus Saccharimonadales bacterium]|nr:hypothetical protein [Candidatus Saccharimonadales bacterium]
MYSKADQLIERIWVQCTPAIRQALEKSSDEKAHTQPALAAIINKEVSKAPEEELHEIIMNGQDLLPLNANLKPFKGRHDGPDWFHALARTAVLRRLIRRARAHFGITT